MVVVVLVVLVLVVVVVVGSRCVCRRARGGAIPLLACAETRVLALCSPGIELCFCFRIGFCGVLEQKSVPAAGLHCAKTCWPLHFASFFPVFSCVCVCVAFCIGFYSIFADSRLSAHAGLDLHFSFSSVWGVEG